MYLNVISNLTYKEIYSNLTANNWVPRIQRKDSDENTKVLLKLSDKYKFNLNVQNNRTEEVFKRCRLESPERDYIDIIEEI